MIDLAPPQADPDRRFAELQAMLRPARWPMGDGRAKRVVVVIPSINLDRTVMSLHKENLQVLEERALFWTLALRRPWVHVVAVTRCPVERVAVDYYLSLLPDREDARRRLTLLSLDNPSVERPLAEMVLDAPEVVDRLRTAVGDDPTAAMMLPFNVTTVERDLALAINAPIYGVDHRFARFGRKSDGRRLFREVGVACAPGVEDVHTASDVATAIASLQPSGDVVVKLNDSVYGDGNVRLARGDDPSGLPRSYLADLERLGGVVEQWIDGDEVASPSVQMRIRPGGEPLIISTHDQLLGGENGQQFMGGRFPASGAYHHTIVAAARPLGERLAAAGVVGRFGIDFVVVRSPDATWRAYAMELNLREGGTSHPYGSLWLLTEGNFDADEGAFRLLDGGRRTYVASDNVPVRIGDAEAMLAACRSAACAYDPGEVVGTVFHMLGAVATENRVAAVTIGRSHADAAARHERLTNAIG